VLAQPWVPPSVSRAMGTATVGHFMCRRYVAAPYNDHRPQKDAVFLSHIIYTSSFPIYNCEQFFTIILVTDPVVKRRNLRHKNDAMLVILWDGRSNIRVVKRRRAKFGTGAQVSSLTGEQKK
jgi:hypothetical protein